ncbi:MULTISPECIES: DUF305 domain-containing protein [Brevundimonas]|jgi:uncharacterized protein (DUF305 family)|uniref:DUF305 domain-containing protein n=1 Tax=Brevundimonas mediterranea TaxID=74329 RepID=A0A7Z9C5J1_9CAUL|nr:MULTISPECIES: DUF305 domain-containing protein [Brevundimonas]MBJ7318424.1 DUF305 domain-containing protein [Brevundimonas sp.]MDP3802043.1 DUF305 domain-containing protein [Brevundimonas sp.]VDC48948.1 hypothetical protein BREV_BREV_00934 [Brevundimonas mediterranea]HWQ85561.1 DUF305 domain-containing protein [Brevundimonas sp.]
MFTFTERPVRRTAIALSTLFLLAVAGCAATASDSGMAMPDRPMAGMSMPQSASSSGMMGQDHAMPPGMNMPRTVFSEAEMGMHRAMMMATDVNTQRTWARKMIAHHRGAIAMSQALLGSDATDAEARRMAQAVIDAQTREIAELESWLERHPG